jgi:hypothetical protein
MGASLWWMRAQTWLECQSLDLREQKKAARYFRADGQPGAAVPTWSGDNDKVKVKFNGDGQECPSYT